MIRRMIRVLGDEEYDFDEGNPGAQAEYVCEAEVITSEIDEYQQNEDILNPDFLFSRSTDHAPVLDIDFPAAVIPSSTPGKFHLWLDTRVPHEKYMKLLDALAEAGIIEEGYASVSKKRGHTAVRLPWVEKPKSE